MWAFRQARPLPRGRGRRAWDLPDLADTRLATGFRIGETSAITWDALDLGEGTVKLHGTVIRLKGQGLILKLRPKRRGSERTLELPSWAVDMLRALRERRDSWVLKVNILQDGAVSVREVEPVFTAPMVGYGTRRTRRQTYEGL
jgi:integrase